MPRRWRGLCANRTSQITERSQLPIRGTSCPRLDAPVQREHLLAHRGEGGAAGAAPSLSSLHQGYLEALIQGIEQVPRAFVAHLHLASCRGDRSRLLDALQQISLTGPDLDVWPNHNAQIQGEFSRSRLQFRAPLTGPVIKPPVYSQATQSARQGCDAIPVRLLTVRPLGWPASSRMSIWSSLGNLRRRTAPRIGRPRARKSGWNECDSTRRYRLSLS